MGEIAYTMHTLTVDEQKTAQVPDAFMNRPIVSQGIGSEITAYARCIRSSPIYTSTSWKTLIALTLDANLLHQQRFSRHVTNHRILFLICVNIDRTFEKSNSKCTLYFHNFREEDMYSRTEHLWRIDSLKRNRKMLRFIYYIYSTIC